MEKVAITTNMHSGIMEGISTTETFFDERLIRNKTMNEEKKTAFFKLKPRKDVPPNPQTLFMATVEDIKIKSINLKIFTRALVGQL